MKIEFLNRFYKDIDKLTVQRVKDDIADVIENVEKAKTIRDIKNIKKLKNLKIAYRIKIGDYRIGIFYENNIIEFARVVHRKDIYKVFP
ncbi:MAG: type II toxin-antitoxin system RelE/ParE family toxin [Bacteroidales bacterium]